jgi:hypothetical protein
LKLELPLHVEDRGDAWLVKGTPYDLKHSRHLMSYAFFRKESAEVTGIMSVARFIPVGGKPIGRNICLMRIIGGSSVRRRILSRKVSMK